MYSTVLTQLTGNSRITETIPAFQAAVTEFQTISTAIRSAEGRVSTFGKGPTRSKKERREILNEFTLQVGGSLHAWAQNEQLTELQEQTDFSLTDLKRLRDEEVAAFCLKVYDLAKGHEAALADYNLSPAVIAEFKKAIDDYDSSRTGPRNATTSKAQERQAMAALFKAADLVLKKKMDKLVRGLAKSHPELVAQYRLNRKLVDTGGRITQLQFSVKNKADGSPVAKAAVVIDALGLNGLTNAEGQLVFKPVSPGGYRVQISCAGYQPLQLEAIKAARGKAVKVEVELEAA